MRRIGIVAALAAAGLALAACSSGTSGNSGTGTKASGQVEVFTWWAAGSEKLGLDAMVGVFNKQHPDVKFINGAVAGGAGSAAKDLLQTRLQAKNPPDTFQATSPQVSSRMSATSTTSSACAAPSRPRC